MKFKDAAFAGCQVIEGLLLACLMVLIIACLPLFAVGALLLSPLIIADWYEGEKQRREYAKRCKEVFGDCSVTSPSVCGDEDDGLGKYGMS